MPTATPARRARARRDPAVLLPPTPPKTERNLAALRLDINGVQHLIGENLDGDADQQLELTMDGASTLTLNVHDPDAALLRALDTQDMLLVGGARIQLDGIVYVLTAVNGNDDRVLTLTLTDYVAWVLSLFGRYMAVSRNKSTAAEFVLRLADEARKAPLAPFRVFIPELTVRQRIARASEPEGFRGEPTTNKGLGDAKIEVKGVKATSEQRQNIDGILTEAARLGASRRVMIATVMAATLESTMIRVGHGDAAGPDSRGLFQQRAAWGPLSVRMDAAGSTRLFLRDGATAWAKVNGSVRTATGSLGAAIQRVQNGPAGSAYNQHEAEATETVDRWLGDEGVTVTRTYARSYLFTRGERNGDRETSWQAIERIATERNFRRWAALNTLHYVSELELRAAKPSLTVDGTEGWIVAGPNWDWGAVDRPVSEVEMVVLSERWGTLPGAVVVIEEHGPLNGRYLVHSVRDPLLSPESTVTLRRPTVPNPEPAHEVATSSYTTSGQSDEDAAADGGGRVRDAAEHISSQGRPYVYGGGHGVPLGSINPSQGLDCSSSTSLALYRGGAWPAGRSTAMVSGDLMSWGEPGRGKTFTVYASPSHVFVVFADGRRFDTSPWGEGGSGPRMRTKPRSDLGRFTARHWPGM